MMQQRNYAIAAGGSYFIIFFAAIFANFSVIENLLHEPVNTVMNERLKVSLGIAAFSLTVMFDVVVAWALYQLYKPDVLTVASTVFRLLHAVLMAVAILALPPVLNINSSEAILAQVNLFNNIWLIGLFFFGIHLMLLARIVNCPKVIAHFLSLAGAMYMIDTLAHFSLPSYEQYADIFLAMVALPAIIGEMSLAIWLLLKAGKTQEDI